MKSPSKAILSWRLHGSDFKDIGSPKKPYEAIKALSIPTHMAGLRLRNVDIIQYHVHLCVDKTGAHFEINACFE